jgi:DNA uptake protein ComE-like DNA-binding protein
MLVLTASLEGRSGIAAAQNRIRAERALWLAIDCSNQTHAAIDDLLSQGDDEQATRVWRDLSVQGDIRSLATGKDCALTVEAAGTRLDINSASDEQIRNIFRQDGRADALDLADALLDWRDADDEPRSLGAERAWYEAEHRPDPRNGRFADLTELRLVRGFESPLAVEQLLTVEPGRISINTAPPAVLAVVPGFTPEVVQRIVEWRSREGGLGDVLAIGPSLSPEAVNELTAHYPEISRTTTVDPDAWIVTATSRVGRPAIASTVQLRLVRRRSRAIVVRGSSW